MCVGDGNEWRGILFCWTYMSFQRMWIWRWFDRRRRLRWIGLHWIPTMPPTIVIPRLQLLTVNFTASAHLPISRLPTKPRLSAIHRLIPRMHVPRPSCSLSPFIRISHTWRARCLQKRTTWTCNDARQRRTVLPPISPLLARPGTPSAQYILCAGCRAVLRAGVLVIRESAGA